MANTCVHIRYAAQQSSASAPTNWSSYTWYKIKGDSLPSTVTPGKLFFKKVS